MFIGREKELKELIKMYETNKFEAALIYGRRRVGKTEIIKESKKQYRGKILHFECKKTSALSNLNFLTQYVNKELNLGNINFDSYDSFFDYVFKFSIDNEFLLIIDEFSFLIYDDATIESSLAIAIDKYKEQSKMKLIVSGSYVGLMNKMIEYGSHCYGRFNHILFVKAFDYFIASKFVPNYSNEDKLKTYAIFGGLPYFLSLIDSSISLEENILNLIIKENSILEKELNEMVLIETKKVEFMNEVITTIASGHNKYEQINSILKQNKSARPSYILEKLITMEIIKREVPINDKNNKKRTLYKFHDNFFDFYYRYIFNSPYSIMRENPKLFFDNFIKEDLEQNFIPKKFEDISKEFLLRLNLTGKIQPFLMDIGTYTYNYRNILNREFDVVSKDKNGYISYECKYSKNKVSSSVVNEEIKQTKNLDISFYKLGFISKEGFEETFDKNKYICYELNDFYQF